MAAKVDAKAQEALGENAGTVIGIGKEAFATETTGTTKTLYEAEISVERTYVKVQENRIEANYPILCCGVCAIDNAKVTYFDRSLGNFEESHFCTPGHLCLFVPFSGAVVKDTMLKAAEPDYLNLCCIGANHFYPGLKAEAKDTFIAKAKEAHAAWKAKHADAKPTVVPETSSAAKDESTSAAPAAGAAADAPPAGAAAADTTTVASGTDASAVDVQTSDAGN